MKETTKSILNELLSTYPRLQCCREDIEKAFLILKETFDNGCRLFVCGNGGSSADSEHIVGELLKSFKKRRSIEKGVYDSLQAFGEEGAYLCEKLEGSLPAYSLNSQTGIMTAFANDKSWEATFAQQLYGLGMKGDCLFTMSTSGNSKNCVYAVLVGRVKGVSSIALTGVGGGKLKAIADCTIAVPETKTYKVQELHLPVYHCLCAMLEEEFF